MFHHILVPLDGSNCAERALPWAARIARSMGAQITLIQVLPSQYNYIDAVGSRDEDDTTPRTEMQSRAWHYLHTIAADESLQNLIMRTAVFARREIPTALIYYAQHHAVDLIVLCSHGRTGIGRRMWGSVAQQMIQLCPIPTVIVHQDHAALPAMNEHGLHAFSLLIALDGSPRAEATVEPAARLCTALSAPLTGKLHLVRVAQPSFTTRSEAFLNQPALISAERYLHGVEEYLSHMTHLPARIQVTTEAILEHDIVRALATFAGSEKPSYDMLAIATHDYHGLPRWLAGSVTEDLLGKIKLPLLVMHQSQADAQQQRRMRSTAGLPEKQPRYTFSDE